MGYLSGWIGKCVATGALASVMAVAPVTLVPAQDQSGPTIVEAELPLSSLAVLFRARDEARLDQVFEVLNANWSDGYYAPLIEISAFTSNRAGREAIYAFLEEKTGQTHGSDVQAWFQWLWNRPEAITADYGDFKSLIYRLVDPVFEGYFAGRTATAQIRLDEIRWCGVIQDGIPPLRQPDMISADTAVYLADDNVVFALEINGDARAYPQRILAWHEMFVDTIGGVEIAGVYCTLCGTVIPYRTTVDGTNHALGTSGFLYRSNKLMYDQATQSLWSTMRGVPVVGQGIEMTFEPIITTTWGEWKRRHPDTTVLSLNTGHSRDYGEGVAYNRYFASDELMFNTPFNDDQLLNKQEVLGLRLPGSPDDQVAIDTAFLANNPVHVETVGFQDVLILTDTSGANSVYDPREVEFAAYDGDRTLTDADGGTWTLSEDALTAEGGRQLSRLPAHRAFWFGWHAAFPGTRLVM
jgi:hypothetical protein